jgi:hypothetical protein
MRRDYPMSAAPRKIDGSLPESFEIQWAFSPCRVCSSSSTGQIPLDPAILFDHIHISSAGAESSAIAKEYLHESQSVPIVKAR